MIFEFLPYITTKCSRNDNTFFTVVNELAKSRAKWGYILRWVSRVLVHAIFFFCYNSKHKKERQKYLLEAIHHTEAGKSRGRGRVSSSGSSHSRESYKAWWRSAQSWSPPQKTHKEIEEQATLPIFCLTHWLSAKSSTEKREPCLSLVNKWDFFSYPSKSIFALQPLRKYARLILHNGAQRVHHSSTFLDLVS